MPINTTIIHGLKEQLTQNQTNQSHTIVEWHEATQRFVSVEMQPLLYGLDITSYAKQITAQLQASIPTFTQLVSWLSGIDPKVVKCSVLVGQFKQKGNEMHMELQSSTPQMVLLKRGRELYQMIITAEGVSGTFVAGDMLLAGNQHMLERIKSISQSEIEKLQALIENLSKAYQLSSKIIVMESFKKKISPRALMWLKRTTSNLISRKNISSPSTLVPDILQRKPILLDKRRKYALILSIVFLMLLTTSVGLGISKRQQFMKSQKEQQLIDNVRYRLEQAKSLEQLNPARAKVLLTEARQALQAYKTENQLSSQMVQNLDREVALAYELVSGLILVQEVPQYFDPLLIKDVFIPTQMTLSDDEISLLDTSNKIAGTVSLESKSSKVIAGSSVIQSNSRIASVPTWLFLLSGNKLSVVDKLSQKQIKSFTLSKTEVSDLVGYGNNLYVLDVLAGQVLRFRGTKDGLSKSEEFFNEQQDLSGAVGISVDGSVWVLYKDGSLEKYTSGLRDALFPDFGLDKPIQEASYIFTDENQKDVYILDKKQGRVIAVSKRGEFVAEYSWEGLKMCDDFVVSEAIGKILVLKDGKIWGIGLK